MGWPDLVRWVDNIARLGRLRNVIDKVEKTATRALERRRDKPTMGAARVVGTEPGTPVYAASVAYVQQIDLGKLQALAEKSACRIVVEAMPGSLASPGKALASVIPDSGDGQELDVEPFAGAFKTGTGRVFDDDPRFGLIVLSEIAARALSPAVNDPGTAIDIVGTFVRLFAIWADRDPDAEEKVQFDRVHVPETRIDDMFDDAFTPIARDGAGIVEVQVRLQKAFAALSRTGVDAMTAASREHSRLALERAGHALKLSEEIDAITKLALDVQGQSHGA